jgi:hypothetical protein
MTTVARTTSMPKLTGIEGIIGSTSHPQPGGKPSIHHPNPPTGNTINHGLTSPLLIPSPGWSRTRRQTLQPREWTLRITDCRCNGTAPTKRRVPPIQQGQPRSGATGRAWLATDPAVWPANWAQGLS